MVTRGEKLQRGVCNSATLLPGPNSVQSFFFLLCDICYFLFFCFVVVGFFGGRAGCYIQIEMDVIVPKTSFSRETFPVINKAQIGFRQSAILGEHAKYLTHGPVWVGTRKNCRVR